MNHRKYLSYHHLPFVGIILAASLVCLTSLSGCASVPPQVDKTHQKELEIIESLRKSHIEMVDSYVDQKLQNFEHFFFHEYGPVYLKNWKESFKALQNRDYDSTRDFPLLYNDLVAEYQAESEPINRIRSELKEAIVTEYRNAIAAHKTIGRWLDNLKKLNEAQRKAIDSLLSGIKPGLSLDSIDKAIETAKANVKIRIDELQKRYNKGG